MPGYGYERMKLKEYLGIEWIKNGLDRNAYSLDKPIRHASDLDCTFDHPEKCRWKNVEAQEALDSLDFHLFEKSDSTEFPVLQVRPGPSKLRRGDKFIFTGDRKEEEQSAIWKSATIKCQNSTGHLSFTFWLYNGARVEVLIFEHKNGRLKVLPEKPFVDCGVVTLNTDCVAAIPPHDTPFSLGIRAYDIKNADGSFVMVDNIYYRASLCKTGIDFGNDFKGEPLMTLTEDYVINSANEIDCTDFNKNCKWMPMGRGPEVLAWKIARKPPDRHSFFNATGTYIIPHPPFAFLYIKQDQTGPFSALRSSVITCQNDEPSKLSDLISFFRFWTTREVLLEVCAIDKMLKDLECYPLPMAQSPNLQTTKKNFLKEIIQIIIRVKKINPDFDNFIAIDDISFKAVLCSETTDEWDLDSNFFMAPMLSVLQQRPILSSKDLDCSFNRRAIDCMWANYDKQNPQWLVASMPVNKQKMYSLTRTMQFPEGEFAIVRLKRAQTAHLISELIRCVSHSAILSFRFWETGSARLKVCLLEEKKPDLVDCQQVTLEQPGPVIVDIPRLKHPFRIAIRAETSAKNLSGMAIIDDLQVSVRNIHGAKTVSFQSFQQPDPNVCRLLSCQFINGQTCLFNLGQTTSSNRFRVAHDFVIANLHRKGKIVILESPNFALNAPARLHFFYQKVESSSLFFCHDSLNRELDGCFEVNSHNKNSTWHHDFVKILPSDAKIYFIGKLRDGFRKGQISIANITLTNLDNIVCA
ncbi:unnamed protein product [Dracunculus medinensis]|uniref:MAM domain-containing protein n=1 Tax=Dracunculus medinensis TaxID=318479 RepID=A0A0N4U3T3_DRAME|nr:unnamed protein product [Dracunculus medinensis]